MIEVVADGDSFRRVARALDAEGDGDALRRDLAANIHAALAPAVAEARGAVLGMASAGLEHDGEPLRAAVAAQVVSEVRLGGHSAGAVVRVRKRGMPRGFFNAPKRLNARRGWRHKVFGADVWITQTGAPGWFDDTMARGRNRYRRAVEKALQDVSERIGRRS